ncbi:MAG: hypothetical protein HEQ26_17370 [Dolichospermum sp. DL01]|nr:MAG: hypothetical protein HEQ26_17370 [Dolichospermum sp. DL01]
MNFKLFYQKLQEASNVQKLQEASNVLNKYSNSSFVTQLHDAIDYWVKELNLPNEAIKYISRKYKYNEHIENLALEAFKEWDNTNSIFGFTRGDNKLKQYIKKVMNDYDFTSLNFIVLIGFLVTASSYAFYLLDESNRKKNQSQDNSPINSNALPQTQNKKENILLFNSNALPQTQNKKENILLLVINASRQNIIDPLKSNHHITDDFSNEIYRITQALWMGNIREFSQFETWFFQDKEVSENEYSEYDVYLVKIELKYSDKGFSRNANQLDRLDAFRKLPENTLNVYVSPRLPSKAYANKDFYSR